MSPLVLIPARMESTRLPGKPLADISGKPMIVRVWEQAMAAKAGRVVVAAAQEEIAAAIRAAGGEVVLTDPNHPSGSDRIKEALDLVDPDKSSNMVINLQGDMPNIAPYAVRSVSDLLAAQAGYDITTLAAPITDPAEVDDPSVVKAVLSLSQDGTSGRALYFTRAAAPTGDGPRFHHAGIYAYRREALERFFTLPPSPLERQEKLEQLRALEAGMTIGVAVTKQVPLSVDTPQDLERARHQIGGAPHP